MNDNAHVIKVVPQKKKSFREQPILNYVLSLNYCPNGQIYTGNNLNSDELARENICLM